ncbi:hypothetical protein L3X38_037388 [Prunus dulcis]|uniref:Transposable element protein n=1 Tax=Prunus dulcis TaxID=3755 RepID=A0AAD4V4J6_PRUDU|nr:hypothetical protein L3X38_037388 [Prunus dulcis]
MTDLGEASYVLGIEISRNREKRVLGLSQKNYIEKVLQRFNMQGCGGTDMPISKAHNLSKEQALRTESIKQPLTIAYTMLAAFFASYEAISQAMWLKNFITRLRVAESIHRPIQLCNDNSAAILFAKGNKRTKASRILDVKFLKVKEQIRDGYTGSEHINTTNIYDCRYSY